MLWQVRETQPSSMSYGGEQRRMHTPSGCNEPYRGRWWCPRRRWFLTSPCPFGNRHECAAFRRLCGSL